MEGQFSTSGFSDALVILGAAGIVIPAFARLRISPVIGFIIVGMIVGPFGLGAMSSDHPWLRAVTISDRARIGPFAEFGIILLLFSIGLELSFRRLWGMRRLLFRVGTTEFSLVAVIIAAVLYFMGESVGGAIALGLALSNSSMALVLPLVNINTPVGRSAFAVLLLEDVAIVPVLFALSALAPGARDRGFGSLGATLALGVLVIAAMLVLGRFLLPKLFAQAARTKSPELFLSASLIVVIAASLATSAVGLSPIIGALVAGILIAETEYRGEVEVVTAPFRGLALGIFLITVGMSIDFRVIAEKWAPLLIALVAVLGVKIVVTGYLLRAAGGVARGVAAEVGLLMASPSEMTLVVIGAAAAAGVISPSTASFWQIVTAMGLTLTPLLATLGRAAGSRLAGQAMAGQMDASLETAAPGQVVILGFGRVGRMVADMLDTHNKDYLAIDSDADCVATSRKEGYDVLFGDVARPELIERLRDRSPSAFILTMDNPVLTNRLARVLRRTFADLPIVARARDTAHAAELYRAGVTDAVPEALEASLQLSEAVLVDLGVAMGPVIASIHEKRDELRAHIKAEAELEVVPRLGGRRLRDANPRTSSRP
jgi:CPA2 family monovalent cation:H+ antiporter-2